MYLNQNKEIHIYTVFHRCVPESKQRKYTFIRSFTAVYLNQSNENTHLYGLSPLCIRIKAKKIHIYMAFHRCVPESKQRKYTLLRSFTTAYQNQNKEIHIYTVFHCCVPESKQRKYTLLRSFTTVYLNQNKEIHIYTVFHRCVPESKQRKYTCIRSFTTVYLNQNKENTHLYGLSPLCT